MNQKQKILEILEDGYPHSNFELHEKTQILRYSARILDLKREGYLIKGWKDEHDSSKYWYQYVKVNLNGVPINVV